MLRCKLFGHDYRMFQSLEETKLLLVCARCKHQLHVDKKTGQKTDLGRPT
jgi:hypothetical protein